MSIYDPYKDPDRVPTTLDGTRLGRSVRGGRRSRRGSGSTVQAGDVGKPISVSDVSRPADPGAASGRADQAGEVGGPIHNRAPGREDPDTAEHHPDQSAMLTVLSTIVT